MVRLMSHLKIRTRLILVFSLIGVVMIALISYANYRVATRLITQEALNKLVSIRETKYAQLTNLFKEKQNWRAKTAKA